MRGATPALRGGAWTSTAQAGATLVPITLPDLPGIGDLRHSQRRSRRDVRRARAERRASTSWPTRAPNGRANQLRASRFIPAVEYIRAQRVRTLLLQQMNALFETVDVFLAPSRSDSVTMTNLTGHPAIVLPAGFVDGMPIALMLTGKLWDEADAAACRRRVRVSDATGTSSIRALSAQLSLSVRCQHELTGDSQFSDDTNCAFAVPTESPDSIRTATRPARPTGCCDGRRPSRRQQLAQIHLRLAVVDAVAFVLDDVELQLRQRAAHVVVPVLRLDDDFLEAARDGPRLGFLGQRAEVALPAPVAAGRADPGIQNAAAVEVHASRSGAPRDRAAWGPFRARGSRARPCTTRARACRDRRAAALRPSGSATRDRAGAR